MEAGKDGPSQTSVMHLNVHCLNCMREPYIYRGIYTHIHTHILFYFFIPTEEKISLFRILKH